MSQETSAELTRAGFRHGFFGRRGGVSRGAWASLNLAASTGDDPEAVRQNRRIVATSLEVGEERVFFLSQVHGVDVVEVTQDDVFARFVEREGDATFSTAPGLACGVRSADCGTVLVADRARRAVLAIHAGWRGAVRGVVEAGIAALVRGGSQPGDLVAATGPMIERCCFEVGEDVAAEIAGAAPGVEGVVDRARPRPHVDLRRVLHAKLARSGVQSVEAVGGCTACDAERYFSYRRDGQVSGRMVAAIVAG